MNISYLLDKKHRIERCLNGARDPRAREGFRRELEQVVSYLREEMEMRGKEKAQRWGEELTYNPFEMLVGE